MGEINFSCHVPDDHCYCRRCGLLLNTASVQNAPCQPPADILQLVNRRIEAIVATNSIERDVQWALRSLHNQAMRRLPRDQ